MDLGVKMYFSSDEANRRDQQSELVKPRENALKLESS